MARPPRWQATLGASVAEACLAVRLYNDPAEVRSFEGFTIHMHLAWLYLLHAEFTRDSVDYRYRDPKSPRRLLKVDGEPKRWELDRCAGERWPVGDPVRANLDLFIRLRNRFEHRHARADAPLLIALAGHSHALLVNYEEELTSQFGPERSLATRLRFPVFVGTFSEGGEQALRRLRKSLPKDLHTFLTDYHAGLEEEVARDPRFEFRLRANLELAPKDPDATALQFTRLEDLTDEARASVEEMGRRGEVIIRERTQGVSGKGLLLPRAVKNEVADKVEFKFNMHHFVQSTRILRVRPSKDDPHPYRTREEFCIYDEPSHQYRYKPAYAKYLVKKCQTAAGFKSVTGCDALPKDESLGESG